MSLGRTYVEQLVDNYTNCLLEGDKGMIHSYDKLFLSKVVADKVDIDLTVNDDLIEAKRVAFTDALAAMARKTRDE
jgi:hypothetical protein